MKISELIRTFLAFLVAPLVPGVVVVSLMAPADLQAWESSVQSSALLGYPIAIVLGLPLFILFRGRGLVGPLTYVGAWAFLGLVGFIWVYANAAPGMADVFGTVGRALLQDWFFLAFKVLCGAVSGLLFWLIARPDLGGTSPQGTAE